MQPKNHLNMTNKEIVSRAMKEFFVDRDSTAIERYWHKSYIQHNPAMINGHQGLRNLLEQIAPGFRWSPGIFIASNDMVLAHSQVRGWGPVPLIVVDIFRFEDGKIAEHWNVVQQEIPAEKTASGNPMTSINLIPCSTR
jgi:predicted SnoaL-like aldol condensation-catalyzing enzyme